MLSPERYLTLPIPVSKDFFTTVSIILWDEVRDMCVECEGHFKDRDEA